MRVTSIDFEFKLKTSSKTKFQTLNLLMLVEVCGSVIKSIEHGKAKL